MNLKYFSSEFLFTNLLGIHKSDAMNKTYSTGLYIIITFSTINDTLTWFSQFYLCDVSNILTASFTTVLRDIKATTKFFL